MTRKAKQTYRVGVASELVVVGYNPENADMDYPNGEIVRERFYLVAEDGNGNRWRYGRYTKFSEAETAYQLFSPPVPLWEPTYPSYGSRAYEAYGEAEAIEAERRQARDEAHGFDTRFTRYH